MAHTAPNAAANAQVAALTQQVNDLKKKAAAPAKPAGDPVLNSVNSFISAFQPYQSSFAKYFQPPQEAQAGYGRSPIRPFIPGAGQMSFNRPNAQDQIASRGGNAGAALNKGPIGQALAGMFRRGGPVRGAGGGQDDNVISDAKTGDYIFRADSVSNLGDGNSEEGYRILDEILEPARKACGGMVKYKKGGGVDKGKKAAQGEKPEKGKSPKIGKDTKIAVSPGEYHVEDEVVTHLGGGDNAKGVAILTDVEDRITKFKKKKKKGKLPPKIKSPFSHLHVKGVSPRVPKPNVNPLKSISYV